MQKSRLGPFFFLAEFGQAGAVPNFESKLETWVDGGEAVCEVNVGGVSEILAYYSKRVIHVAHEGARNSKIAVESDRPHHDCPTYLNEYSRRKKFQRRGKGFCR